MAKKKGKTSIDRERCKGCLLCVRACPVEVLEKDTEPNLSGSYPVRVVSGDQCVACGNCYEVCPDLCIVVYEDSPVSDSPSDSSLNQERKAV